MKSLFICALAALMVTCFTKKVKVQPLIATTLSNNFNNYWYGGEAEINSYEVSQFRYNDNHQGKAVLIFVTEDFLTDKQVKNDNYKNTNSVSVLKTNYLKKFPTGIYDYSLMTSVFNPIANQNKHALKITTSVQDWCGHVWMQVNNKNENLKIQTFSYFESEADDVANVAVTWMEDELMNKLRLNPQNLPIGKFTMLPSLAYLRMIHKPTQTYECTAQNLPYNKRDMQGENLQSYKVNYPSLKRTLEIVYEGDFPFKIMGWKDSYPNRTGEMQTSTHQLIKSIKSAYWNKNSLSDQGLREELGLE